MDFDDMRPREGDDDPRFTEFVADDREEWRDARRSCEVFGMSQGSGCNPSLYDGVKKTIAVPKPKAKPKRK